MRPPHARDRDRSCTARKSDCVEETVTRGPRRPGTSAGRSAGTAARAARRYAGTAAAPRWSSDAGTFHSPGETRRPPGCRAVPPCRLAWGCPSLYIKEQQRAMELRHLRYFVAVAEERSFSGAATRLRVAQPSLSKQIRDLENELGTVLLERGPRGVHLTAAGRAFLIEARHTLDVAARAVT